MTTTTGMMENQVRKDIMSTKNMNLKIEHFTKSILFYFLKRLQRCIAHQNDQQQFLLQIKEDVFEPE